MSPVRHVAHTVSNINNNRNLLKSNSNRYATVKEAYLRNEAHFATFKQRELSPAELKDLKKKIRERIVSERRHKVILSLFLAIPVFLAAIYGLVRFAQKWF